MIRLSLLALVVGCSDGQSMAPDASSPSDRRFDVNDVSILFPLPATDARRASYLWLVPRAGETGPYFPLDKADELGALNADLPDDAGYPSSMITSLRFDPCFPRLGGETCQAQLRLVAQPVFPSANGARMLDDAAAHLFYELSAAEADEVIDALADIRSRSPLSTAGPLRPHPGLVADLEGSTGDAVRALVVAHARADNLIRITVNSFAMDNWGFRRFDRASDGTLERQPIRGMTTTESSQAWLRQAQRDSLDDPTGTITPTPTDGFTYLLAASSFASGAPIDASAARAAATRLLAIENPDLTTADEMDCASCHLATQARLFAARNGVPFDAATRFQPPSGITAELSLDPQLDGNLGATIAFGYHTRANPPSPPVPSISQRTVNESAAIAAYLDERNP